MQESLLINMTEGMIVAPIALFAYSRPWHTKQTVEALQRNALAEQSDLFIFSDAPKRPDSADAVRQVRDYIKTISGFKSINVVERAQNLGLAKSIIDGATYLSNQCGRFIVLEDDIVTSPHFLTFMNEALERYANDDRVISIHGYVYPVAQPLPEAFFLPGADCWGWATWRRGWALFNPDGRFLLNELKRRKLTRSFDFSGSYPYTEMLASQIKGINDSWAVRWYASAFLADKLTLYPGRSLVHNIGNDNSGTHCGDSRGFDALLSDTPINLEAIRVEPSVMARQSFEGFFKQGKSGLLRRFLGKVRAFSKLEHR
jgi:hypothetical protein